jgi:CRP-like cAMP-binding protein
MGEGSFVGEISMLIPELPRTCTVTSRTHSELYKLHKEDWDEVMLGFPHFEKVLQKIAASRISRATPLERSREKTTKVLALPRKLSHALNFSVSSVRDSRGSSDVETNGSAGQENDRGAEGLILLSDPELQARVGKKHCKESELMELLLEHGFCRREHDHPVQSSQSAPHNRTTKVQLSRPTIPTIELHELDNSIAGSK